jgi:membrane-bound lytic murein transglycosylase D
MPNHPSMRPPSGSLIYVRVQQGSQWLDEQSFADSFRIGRSPECDLLVSEPVVSKIHTEIRWEEGRWWLVDAQSRNGTYLNGERIQRVPLPSLCKVELGRGGPVLRVSVGDQTQVLESPLSDSAGPEKHESVTKLMEWMEETQDTGKAGPQTTFYQQAAQRLATRHSRRYQVVIGIVGLLLVGTALVAWHQYDKIQQLRETAGEIFYTMKRVELQVAQLEELFSDEKRKKEMEEILAKRQEIRTLETKYDKFIREVGIYDSSMSEQDRAVFRIARLFGECEATMPKEFLAEVKKYVQKWKSTDRLANGMRRALAAGYTGTISNAMFTNNLPSHFFYLALQESGFDSKAVGPKTRMGYAKGMWQFVPSTAKEYGLKPGPLQEEPRYDPDDDRFNPKRATEAAAKYIKRIYLTDAQASGLLVMASYNWGEGNVVKMIRQLPKNPQERNLWQLLKKFKIPQETYDYVFYIIAAAVIGENPQLFGFNFPAPFPNGKTL